MEEEYKTSDTSLHAHWVLNYYNNEMYCSNCRRLHLRICKTDYCPDCGAKMDEKSREI